MLRTGIIETEFMQHTSTNYVGATAPIVVVVRIHQFIYGFHGPRESSTFPNSCCKVQHLLTNWPVVRVS